MSDMNAVQSDLEYGILPERPAPAPKGPTLANWPRRYLGELYHGTDRQGERVLIQTLIYYVSPQNSSLAERDLKQIAYLSRCDYIKLYPLGPCEKPNFAELAQSLKPKPKLIVGEQPPTGKRIILPK